MDVRATTTDALRSDADTVAIGVIGGERIAHDVPEGTLQGLVDAGEARARPRHLAVAHVAGRRVILVGLGERDGLDAERAAAAAAAVEGRARELGTRALCWELPHRVGDEVAGALVEGTVLSAYRFDRYRSSPPDDRALERLEVSAHHDVSGPVERARIVAEAVNHARDLQNAPANDMTPSALADAARALAGEVDGLHVEVAGPDDLEQRGMGAFAAVARGSAQEPRLITICYDGSPRGEAETLALVGKAVTFDSGGLSIKQAARMHEMKFDMSGGAAVLAALGALARLAVPVRALGVIGATENLPSGTAAKPGDIVRARNGTTIEVNNTDAEGRLVLADCLCHAVDEGADRIVDLATLTGGIEVTFGSTYAGLFSDDDAWAAAVEAAGRASGDLVWRLPLHESYAEMIKGRYADIVNTTAQRKAVSITAAHFLRRFTADVPWAHVDIAGTAYDAGRPWAPTGGNGFGVRLLVALAERMAAGAPSAA
jgi:leucyl aminopeptidase